MNRWTNCKILKFWPQDSFEQRRSIIMQAIFITNINADIACSTRKGLKLMVD